MFKLKKENMKRMLGVHGWAGVALGLLMYVVVLTGAIVVFGHELGEWSISGADHAPLTEGIDDNLRRLAADVPPEHLEDVALFMTHEGYIKAFFHTHKAKDGGGPVQDFGTLFKFNPETGEVVSKQVGFSSELSRDPSSALERFLVLLHVRLHVPGKIGLYLTGILGLVLLVAAVSGLLLHRHLFKEMFLSPRIGKNRALTARDKHNLAGTWGLPFAFILAFTGAFFSFALSLGLPIIAITAFEGDQQKAVDTIVGVPQQVDDTPALMASTEWLFRRAEAKERAPVIFATITHWGTVDAKVQTLHDISDGQLYPKSHVFSMATGDYLGTKPRLGKVPSTGNALVNLMGVLHFGTFAGLLSQLIWFSLGLATCYVTISGIRLWIKRREEEQPLWFFFRQCTDYVAYGLPIACVASAMGFFYGYPKANTFDYTVNGFFVGCLLAAGVGLAHIVFGRTAHVVKTDVLEHVRAHQLHTVPMYEIGLGVLLFALPWVRMLASGTGWGDLFAREHVDVIGMDLALSVAGVMFVYSAYKRTRKHVDDAALHDKSHAVLSDARAGNGVGSMMRNEQSEPAGA